MATFLHIFWLKSVTNTIYLFFDQYCMLRFNTLHPSTRNIAINGGKKMELNFIASLKAIIMED